MIAVRITDTRKFMSDLFSRPVFDSFLVGEAQITTYTTFRIDGSWHPEYFSDSASSDKAASSNALADSNAAAAGNAQADGSAASEGKGGTVQTQEPSSFQEPTWGRLRQLACAMVSGKHSPVSFRIVLKLSEKGIQNVLTAGGVSCSPEQVGGLFINISYQNKEVTCTSGTSMKAFTLDRSLDLVWDQMMLKLFSAKGISAEEL